MIPTYVFGWPTGKETGKYLAVDLGEYAYLCSFLAPLHCTPHHLFRRYSSRDSFKSEPMLSPRLSDVGSPNLVVSFLGVQDRWSREHPHEHPRV